MVQIIKYYYLSLSQTQLFALMQHLDNTTPHFICCLKPNENKIPGVFEKGIVLQQLMCCGLLEAMRISRMGYPTRITHQKFVARYFLSFIMGFLLIFFSKTTNVNIQFIQVWVTSPQGGFVTRPTERFCHYPSEIQCPS